MLFSPVTTANVGLAGLVTDFELLGVFVVVPEDCSDLVLSASQADSVAIHNKIHESFNGLTNNVFL
jgi:hypothetical protein